MTDKMIALLVTALLAVGLLLWGIVMHFCCGYAHRRRIERASRADDLSTMR